MNLKILIAAGAMILFTGTILAQTCTPAPNGLAGWWPGDDNAIDLQGGSPGSLVNGATYAPGKVGKAFSVDGIDDYIAIPHSAAFNIQDAITIDAWVYKRGHCGADTGGVLPNCIIVMKQNEADSPTCCNHGRYGLIVLGQFNSNANHATLGFFSGGWSNKVTSANPIPDNEWTHIAGTFDGNVAKIYINGVLSSSQPHVGVIAATTQGPLYIGAARHGYDEFFNGDIDEVEVFNRALTDEEILAIYDAGSAGKCKAESLACVGFAPPMATPPVKVKKNRALPLKAEILDFDGFELTDNEIGARPVVQVWYEYGTSDEDLIDIDALPAGQGDEGNQFVFTDDGKWQFNLKTNNYTAVGTYTIFMESGDSSEYVFDTMCESSFVVK